MKKSIFCQEVESKGYVVNFFAEDEDVNPVGHFENDEEALKVCEDYNNGNQAAWFCAKVTVTDAEGNESEPDFLGCCSYKSFDDFTSENGGYFDDMISNCLAQIESDKKTSGKRVQ